MAKKLKKSKLASKLSVKQQSSESAPAKISKNEAMMLLQNLQQQGKNAEAAQICKEFLEYNPNDVDVLFLLGTFLSESRDYQGALPYLQKVIQLNPNHAEAYNNLGNLLYQLQQYKDACDMLQKAVTIKPSYYEAWHNLGSILKKTYHGEASVECFRNVLKYNPDYLLTLKEAASVFGGYGYYDLAWECYDKQYKVTGDEIVLISRDSLLPIVVPQKDKIPRFRKKFEETMEKYAKSDLRVQQPEKHIKRTSFQLAYHGISNKDLMIKQAKMFANLSPHLLFVAPHCKNKDYPKKNSKLKIGFISKYFYDHSVSRSYNKMIEIFSGRDNMEVYGITTSEMDIDDDVKASLLTKVAGYISISGDVLMAQRKVAELELDILIYTEIGMDQLTYCLAFSRLAPIQMVLPGHPDTTGIETIDYYVACRQAEPEDPQRNYSEELLLFDDVPQYVEPIEYPKKIIDKKELGLPEDKNIYSCPMKLHKLHPDFDFTMKKILEADPNGVIILFKDQGKISELLMDRLKANIPPELMERVIMVPWASKETFPSYLIHSDVVLDPYHFGGGTTCYILLALGVPMVTWPGDSVMGRCAISCYLRMGMMDLVAKDWDEYVDLAVKVGTDKEYRKTLSKNIKEKYHLLFHNQDIIDEFADRLENLAEKKEIF